MNNYIVVLTNEHDDVFEEEIVASSTEDATEMAEDTVLDLDRENQQFSHWIADCYPV